MELNEKLLTDSGVPQLVSFITELAETPKKYDDFENNGYTIDQFFIYPIIVYTDISFGMTGVNHYINTKFMQ